MVPGKVTVKGIRCFPHLQEGKNCTRIISSTLGCDLDLARVELRLEYSVHILVFTTSAIRSMQGPVGEASRTIAKNTPLKVSEKTSGDV